MADVIMQGFTEFAELATEDMKEAVKTSTTVRNPSYAAMFVIGKSANGLTSWKNESGQTLKSLESVQG